MSESVYPLGKLPGDHLARLLASYTAADPRLIVGGQVGEDAAIIDMGDRYLVAKTDPITFATDEIGWYAVNVNANDIACTGATPKWFLATVLLPEAKTTPTLVDHLFQQITAACQHLNIALAGGHTEITHDLNRPIIIGQMLGEVSKDNLVLTKNAQPGDTLILTKQIAIEATAIIAQEMQTFLSPKYPPAKLEHLANYLHNPGISIVPDAKIAMQVGGIHAMHDPTEGGIATGLWELSTAATVGLEIWADQLPFDTDCLALCREFNLNPLGIIASGSLLMAVDSEKTAALKTSYDEAGIQATVIGKVREKEFGVQLVHQTVIEPLPTFARDEITKLFE